MKDINWVRCQRTVEISGLYDCSGIEATIEIDFSVEHDSDHVIGPDGTPSGQEKLTDLVTKATTPFFNGLTSADLQLAYNHELNLGQDELILEKMTSEVSENAGVGFIINNMEVVDMYWGYDEGPTFAISSIVAKPYKV